MAGSPFMALPVELRAIILGFAVHQDGGIHLREYLHQNPFHPALSDIGSIRSTSFRLMVEATRLFFLGNTFHVHDLISLRSFIMTQGPNLPHVRHINISPGIFHGLHMRLMRTELLGLLNLLTAFTRLETLTFVIPWAWDCIEVIDNTHDFRQVISTLKKFYFTRPDVQNLLPSMIAGFNSEIEISDEEILASLIEEHLLDEPSLSGDSLELLVKDYENIEASFANGQSIHLLQPAPELRYLWKCIRAAAGYSIIDGHVHFEVPSSN